jgi:hypothetical protein
MFPWAQWGLPSLAKRERAGTSTRKALWFGLSLVLLLLAPAARAQVQLAIATPTYPANGSYFNLQNNVPNFNWIGPSTTTIALSTSPVWNLDVNTDPTFVSGAVISISTPAVILSTNLAGTRGTYISGTPLSNNTTYYWRVYATDGSGGQSMSWSTFSFVTNFANSPNVSASNFGSLNSSNQFTPENTFITLASGVTSQISVADSISGLAISTSAFPFSGDDNDAATGTSGYGVLYSTDAGSSWEDYSALNISVPYAGANIDVLAVFNGFLYAGLSNGTIIYTSNGTLWNTVYSGSGGVGHFVVFNNHLFATTNAIVSINTSNGVSVVFNAGATGLGVFNGTLFAAFYPGSAIYSTQDGVNWVYTANLSVCSDNYARFFTFNGEIYANINESPGISCSGLFRSPDGFNWTNIEYQSTPGTLSGATVFNGKLYAGTQNGGANPLIYSSQDGLTWTADNGSLTNPSLGGTANTLGVANGKLYVGISTNTAKIYETPDGTNWFPTISGGTGQGGAGAPVNFNGTLYAAAGPDLIRLTPVSTTLPGGNGTPSGTLSATNLNLVTSTSATTCGGTYPCTATNQVMFTASDMAGNTVRAGPYAVLVDTTVEPAISTQTYPANGQYINVNPNFDWQGPSAGLISSLQQPVHYNLEVSNSSNFSSLLISISTPAIIVSTAIPTVNGAYISTYPATTFANNTSYYWRVQTIDGFGAASAWSNVASFVTDFSSPSGSGFESFNQIGSSLTESQLNTLAAGVTAQITVQDSISGLAVSSGALAFLGDGHDDPQTTSGFGAIYSTNAGQNWISWAASTSALVGSSGDNMGALASFAGELYAGDYTHGDVYVSPDGINWSGTSVSSPIYALAAFNGELYAGSNGSVFSDSGGIWSLAANIGNQIRTFAVLGGTLYAGDGANGHVYSSANGTSWSDTATGANSIYALAAFNGAIYAGDVVTGKIYESANNTAWNTTGITLNQGIAVLAVFNGRLYAGGIGGDVYSSVDGKTWNVGIPVGSDITAMSIFNGQLYAGDANGYLHFTSDGVNWSTGTYLGAGIISLSSYNGNFYAGDTNGQVHQLAPVTAVLSGSDGTTSAETLSTYGLDLVSSTNSITCGGVYPCGATDQIIFTASNLADNALKAGPYAVFVDTTLPAPPTPSYPANGQNIGLDPNFDWTGPSTSIVAGLHQPAYTNLEVSNSPAFSSLLISISTPAVVSSTQVTTADGAYISTYPVTAFLSGTTYYWRIQNEDGFGNVSAWSSIYSFVTDFSSPTGSGFESFNAQGSTVTEPQINLLLSGVTAQITIQETDSGLAVSSSAVSFSGDGHDNPQVAGDSYGAIYSTDTGQSWISSVSSYPVLTGETAVNSLAEFQGNIYAATSNGGKVFVNGSPWSTSFTDGTGNVSAMTVFNNQLYAGDSAGKLYSYNGSAWSAAISGYPGISAINSIDVFNKRIYCADSGKNIYSSPDGVSWSRVFSGSASLISLANFNGQIYVGDSSGHLYSSPNGTLWSQQSGYPGSGIFSLAVFSGKLYAGDTNGLYVSSNGAAWSKQTQYPGTSVHALAVFSGELYVGDGNGNLYASANGAIWSRSLSVPGGTLSALSGFNDQLYAGDQLGNLWQVTPISTILSGSDGTSSAQTLSIQNINLAPSQTTLTCGGISPCSATNQVLFSASNMAGNSTQIGPYAILVDTIPTDVILTTANVAPSSIPQGTDAAFIRMTLQSVSGTAPWTGITVQRVGGGTDSDVSNVSIWRDSLNDGVFSSTVDAQISNPVSFSGGEALVVFTSTENIHTSTQAYFVVLTANYQATDGDTIGSEIASTASFVFSSGYSASGGQKNIYPLISSTATIVDGPNNLDVTPVSQAPSYDSPGTTGISMLALKFQVPATTPGTSTLSKIVFHLQGTAPSNDISSISLYRDNDNNGIYDPGVDGLVSSGNDSFTNGVATVAFTAPAASDTVNETPIYYFAVINLSVNAALGDTMQIAVTTTTDVQLIDTLDTVVFLSTPVASSTMTVENLNTLSIVGANLAPASFLQGISNYTVLKASFNVNTQNTAFAGISVNRLGIGHDTDVSSVKFWQDPNPPEAFDPAIFNFLGSAQFTNGVAQINFSTQTLYAGTTYVYFVTYDISPTAVTGDTLGGRIQSSLSITLTNPGTSISGTFPIDSSTSPITATQAGLFVSGQDEAPSSLMQGATNQQMLNLTLNTTQYALALSALTIQSSGTATSLDISRAEIYQDAVGNGILSVSQDPLLAAANYPFVGGAAVLSLTNPLNVSTTPIRLIMAVDISSTADYYHTFGVAVTTTSDLSVNAPNFIVPSTTTFPANSSVVPITKEPDIMTPSGTSLINPAGVVQAQEALAAEITVSTLRSSVTWTNIAISRDGSLPDSGIDAVKVYADSDGNGVWDSSDVLIGSGTFISGLANIAFFNPQITNVTPLNYFVTLTIDINATPGDTIGISLAGASNFTVAPPDTVSGSSLPFVSALAPILNAKTPTQPLVTLPNGSYTSSFDSVTFIWYSTVSVGSISSAAYAVGTTPGGVDVAPYTAIPLNASSFTATGLLFSNGATYYVSVEATSNYGYTSPVGTSPGFLVDLITPGPPTNLAAQIGASSIYLNWNPGTAGPSGLSGYLLEYSDVEHPTWYNAKTGAVTALVAGPHGTLSANFIPASPFLFNNPPQGTLLFRVSSVNGAGVQSSPSNTIRVLYGTQSTAGISNVSSYPNPFNSNSGVATIVYTLDAPGNVTIEIYSVFGNLVRTMSFSGGGAGGEQGVNTVTWDGSDAGGRKVSKGIYIAILKANGATVQYKIGVIH